MNSVRLLTALGALIIGTLGLEAPAALAASSYTSYAPANAGRTTYSTDGRQYQIYVMTPDYPSVGVLFYSQGRPADFRLFHVCDAGAGNSCSGILPREFTGPFCMGTGVGSGTDEKNYKYGQPVCFPVDP